MRLLSSSITVLPRYVILFLLMALYMPAQAAPIQMPPPITALPNLKDTEIAIVQGMGKRGWVVEKEEDQRILASVNVRNKHTAKVWISFSTSEISFAYGGSENLKCKPQGDSCSSIHKNYNSWVSNLATDISNAISTKRVESKYSQ